MFLILVVFSILGGLGFSILGVLGLGVFDQNLAWPKLFQTKQTRRLAHLPSFCELVYKWTFKPDKMIYNAIDPLSEF